MSGKDKKKNKGGRPTTYNKEIAAEICEVISSNSMSLRRLCEKYSHWPDPTTIFLWRNVHEEFSNQYAQAKKEQIEVYIEEIMEIADYSEKDTITKVDKNGNEYQAPNKELVNRSRLRIDTRKWIAAKLAPKIYGDNSLSREINAENSREHVDQIRDDLVNAKKR